jgi:hypothetical protein
MRKLLFPLCFALSACLPANAPDTASRNPSGTHVLAQIKTFPAPTPKRASVSNADLQRDFLDLSFMLESGTPLLHFSRFEGPISLKVVGNVPVTLPGDLGRLIYRLKSEAGLDIFITSQDTANIYLHTIPSSQIKAALPSAACFVVPNVSSLTEYRALRKTKLVSWQSMRERRKISIFIPNDTSPQEIRDCLHEELAQAIGPLNDMYRLPQSIFNDDNVHTVLTAHDMLILRMFYAPELRSGMTRAEVKSRLPSIANRLNPAGDTVASRTASDTPRAWATAIQTALFSQQSLSTKITAAQKALRIANEENWNDHRTAYTLFVLASLMHGENPEAAKAKFQLADKLFKNVPTGELHRAYVATQLASFSLSNGYPVETLALLEPHLKTALRYENAELLATLQLLRAEALELTGRSSEAQAIRVDSLGWARYGFKSDADIQSKLRQIETLSPLKRSNKG